MSWTSSSGAEAMPREDRVGLLVARLDALEVEDREPAEAASSPATRGVDDGVHRRREDRDRERRCRRTSDARSTSAGSMVSVPGASETSSKPYVGRMPVDLRMEARRCAAPSGVCVVAVRSITWPSCAASLWAALAPSLPAATRLGRGPAAGGQLAEPARALRVRRGRRGCARWPSGSRARRPPGAPRRPGASARRRARGRGSARRSGSRPGPRTPPRSHRVDRWLVELVHEIQVVERLDRVRIEAGLLAELAQRALRDALAILEAAPRRTATGPAGSGPGRGAAAGSRGPKRGRGRPSSRRGPAGTGSSGEPGLDLVQLLQVHQVVDAREEQPLPAAEPPDLLVDERAGIGLVAGDRRRAPLYQPLALRDLANERRRDPGPARRGSPGTTVGRVLRPAVRCAASDAAMHSPTRASQS